MTAGKSQPFFLPLAARQQAVLHFHSLPLAPALAQRPQRLHQWCVLAPWQGNGLSAPAGASRRAVWLLLLLPWRMPCGARGARQRGGRRGRRRSTARERREGGAARGWRRRRRGEGRRQGGRQAKAGRTRALHVLRVPVA